MEKIKFSQLQISKEILKGVEDMGFEEATAIQTKSIPLIMEGKDVIGHSQTGTGKTAAFGFPVWKLMKKIKETRQFLFFVPPGDLLFRASDGFKNMVNIKKG